MFDARLPATTTNNGIQFPGETKLNYSDVRDAAQIVIPAAVILNQFSSEGTYNNCMNFVLYVCQRCAYIFINYVSALYVCAQTLYKLYWQLTLVAL